MEQLYKNILLDQPLKIKVETRNEFEDSLFKEVYNEAAENVFSIIQNSKSKDLEIKFYNDVQDYNNIIAFTGDRGVGKTSAMISFVNELAGLNTHGDDKYTDITASFEKISKEKSKFTILKVIEPSNFVKGERLFEIVISNMFGHIKEIFEKSSKAVDKNDINEIYGLMDEVFSSLRVMYSDKRDILGKQIDIGSGLEALEQLSVREKLKCSFNRLVDKYLKLYNTYELNKGKDYEIYKNTFLVIPIDDLDMNMENGYEMAEEIRKYLVTKNVIVTMAINVGQFTKIVQQEYTRSLKLLVDKNLLNNDPSDMAAKYITKLIPTNRRIVLPSFDIHNIANITIECKTESDDTKTEVIYLVDYFLKKIYKTTGIMLIKNDSKSHEIIPANLRELNYLNQLLKDMEEGISKKSTRNILYESKENENTRSQLARNLEKFEDYLIRNFINSDMPKSYSDILLELMKQTSENMNKYLVRVLVGSEEDITDNKKIITISKNAVDSNDKEIKLRVSTIKEIASPDAFPLNISIGDVLFILQQLSVQKSDYQTRKFIAGIRIVYSMRIIRHIFIEDNRLMARRILGEFLYNTESNKLLPLEKDSGDRRDMFIVRNVSIQEYVKNAISDNNYLNCLISRFTVINNENTFDNPRSRDAYKDNYISSYEYIYTGGATNNIVINVTSFILNLLDLDIINNRLDLKRDDVFKASYETWVSENIAVLPVWSLDFIEQFFKKIGRMTELSLKENKEVVASVKINSEPITSHVQESMNSGENVTKTSDTVSKQDSNPAPDTIQSPATETYVANTEATVEKNKSENTKSYVYYIGKFLEAIKKTIENITCENKHLHESNLVEAYTKNPVLYPGLLESPTDKEFAEILEKLWNTKDYKIKVKNIQILKSEVKFKNYEETLIKVIEKLCSVKPTNLKLITESEKLKVLDISNEKPRRGQGKERKPLSSIKDDNGNSKGLYLKTKFSDEKILELCQTAMEVTGNKKEDFKLIYE